MKKKMGGKKKTTMNMRRWTQSASSRAAGGRPCPVLRWPTAPRAAAAPCRALFKLIRGARRRLARAANKGDGKKMARQGGAGAMGGRACRDDVERQEMQKPPELRLQTTQLRRSIRPRRIHARRERQNARRITRTQRASPRLTRKPAPNRENEAAPRPGSRGRACAGKGRHWALRRLRANLKTPKTLSRLDRFFFCAAEAVGPDPSQLHAIPRNSGGDRVRRPVRRRADTGLRARAGIGTIRRPMPAFFFFPPPHTNPQRLRAACVSSFRRSNALFQQS